MPTKQMHFRCHACINEFFSAKHDCATGAQPNDRARQHIGAPFFGHKSPAARAAELWLAKVCPERANCAFSEKF